MLAKLSAMPAISPARSSLFSQIAKSQPLPNFCGRLRFDPRTAHRPAIASRREMGQTNVSADKPAIDPLRIYIQAERFLFRG